MSDNFDKNVLLSVVVPVYNTKLYLEKALTSILNSTFRNFELILIDDGSTDGSSLICDQYQHDNPDRKIRVFHIPNGGLSAARNLGFSRACGKYITYTDSDDWIEPELFEALVDAAEKHEAQVAICGIRYYDEQTEHFESFADSLFPERLAGSVFSYKDCNAVIRGLLDCSTCNKIFLREFIACNNFCYDVDCHFGEDSRYWAKVFFAAERLTLVGRELYNYRINQKRSTNCVKAKKSYDSFVETMRHVRDTMARYEVFESLSGEFVAYVTMQFVVAYCNISYERKRSFYRECKQLLKEKGGFHFSQELNFFVQLGVMYTYGVLRYLPYWCGFTALLPLVVLKSSGVKKIIRHLSAKF